MPLKNLISPQNSIENVTKLIVLSQNLSKLHSKRVGINKKEISSPKLLLNLSHSHNTHSNSNITVKKIMNNTRIKHPSLGIYRLRAPNYLTLELRALHSHFFFCALFFLHALFFAPSKRALIFRQQSPSISQGGTTGERGQGLKNMVQYGGLRCINYLFAGRRWNICL